MPMTALSLAQESYLKALAKLTTRRRQMADMSVDSSLPPKVRRALEARLEREIEELSAEAEQTIAEMTDEVFN